MLVALPEVPTSLSACPISMGRSAPSPPRREMTTRATSEKSLALPSSSAEYSPTGGSLMSKLLPV